MRCQATDLIIVPIRIRFRIEFFLCTCFLFHLSHVFTNHDQAQTIVAGAHESFAFSSLCVSSVFSSDSLKATECLLWLYSAGNLQHSREIKSDMLEHTSKINSRTA